MFRCSWPLLASLLLLLPAQSAHSEEHYYMVVFAAQTHPSRVRNSHSFATFVHARGAGADPARWEIDTITISWMAASRVLHPLRVRPEPGANLELAESFAWAQCRGSCLTMWGPYEICPELFCKAADRLHYLQSGVPQYNVVDRFRRPLVLDCIHALSGVDQDPGHLHTRTGYGDIASYFDLHHLGRWIIHPEVTHDWVADRLGLNGYPIRRLGYWDEPASLLPLLPPYYTSRSPFLVLPRFRTPH